MVPTIGYALVFLQVLVSYYFVRSDILILSYFHPRVSNVFFIGIPMISSLMNLGFDPHTRHTRKLEGRKARRKEP